MLQNLAKETAIYGGGDFVMKLLAFFTFPLIAAAFSPAEFGTLELFATLIGILGIFARCGLNNAAQRYYWEEAYSAERPAIVSTGLVTMLMLGSVVLAACLIALFSVTQVIDLRFEDFTFLAVAAVLGLVVVSQLQQFILDTLRLQFSPWKFLGYSLLVRVAGVVLALVVVVWLRYGIDGFLLVQFLVAGLGLPLGLYLVKADLEIRFDKTWFRRLLIFGYPFIFADLAYWIFSSTDRWMLAAMVGVEETAVYAVASRFASIVIFASVAFGMAWSPYAIKIKSERPEDYRSVYASVLVVLLAGFLIIAGALSLFAGEIIFSLMPPVYVASAVPTCILCFAAVIQVTQQVTGVGISLEKKTSVFARIAWIVALINVIANVVLIPVLGASGAALGSLLAFLALSALYLFYTQSLHPFPFDYQRILFLLFLAAAVLVVSLFWARHDFIWGQIVLKIIAMLMIGGIALVVAWQPIRFLSRPDGT